MRWWALVLVCACRFQWDPAPPRISNQVKLALYAPDANGAAITRAVLGSDEQVAIVVVEPAVLEPQQTLCGAPGCAAVSPLGCAWAANQGAELYAVARLSTRYEQVAASTVASYTLDVYDVAHCVRLRALSKQVTTRGYGPEDKSTSEAIAKLSSQRVALPQQITIASDGRIVRPVSDGYYEVFEGDEARGHVAVSNAATIDQEIRPLQCCSTPTSGDVLEPRAPRRFLEVAPELTFGWLAGGFAAGLGVHVRYFALDGGPQVGVSADAMLSKAGILTFRTPEVGWGFPITGGVVLSANVGVGWATSARDGAGENGTTVEGTSHHVVGTARLQSFFTSSIYVTGDVGYLYVGEQSSNAGSQPIGVQGMLVHVHAGATF